MKTGDRLALKFTRDVPPCTVRRVYPDGSFQVIYDRFTDAEGKMRRGGKYTYQARQRTDFVSVAEAIAAATRRG
jgi:hypothetical protein